jgi:hypothetical protein
VSAGIAETEPVTASAVAHAASRYMTTTNSIALMLSRLRADLVADDRDGVGVWAEEVAFLQQTLEDANQDMHGLIHRRCGAGARPRHRAGGVRGGSSMNAR